MGIIQTQDTDRAPNSEILPPSTPTSYTYAELSSFFQNYHIHRCPPCSLTLLDNHANPSNIPSPVVAQLGSTFQR